MSDIVHVSPIGDQIKHDLDGNECVCGPRSEAVKRDDGTVGWVIVHNSLDGRETGERMSLVTPRRTPVTAPRQPPHFSR